MALRAGYYGVKRFLRNKLETIAGTYNETIKSLFPRSEQALLGAKNRFNSVNYKGGKVPTITDKGKSINIASSDSATWQGTYWYISVEKNTNYRLVGNAVVTSGGGLLNVKTTDNVTELATTGTFTTNEGIELTFNSGNNTELRVSMFCSLGTASVGDVSYNDISCVLATDPDNTYVPYAMTNRELTDSASDQKTAINAIITAATGAADFAAFKTAMGAITPVTRSLSLTKADLTEEVNEAEPEKKVTKKRTTKKTEEV